MLTSNKKLYLILIKFKVNINVDFSKVLYSIVKAHAYDFLLYLTDVFALLQMYTRFVFLRYLCNGRQIIWTKAYHFYTHNIDSPLDFLFRHPRIKALSQLLSLLSQHLQKLFLKLGDLTLQGVNPLFHRVDSFLFSLLPQLLLYFILCVILH